MTVMGVSSSLLSAMVTSFAWSDSQSALCGAGRKATIFVENLLADRQAFSLTVFFKRKAEDGHNTSFISVVISFKMSLS